MVSEGGVEKKVIKLLQVFSRQAPMMDAMLGRCVTDIDSREEQQRQEGIAQYVYVLMWVCMGVCGYVCVSVCHSVIEVNEYSLKCLH